jgi:catalase
VRNFQRDGSHRLAIARGAVAYEPNSLASGTEFRADGGEQGYQSFPETIQASKARRRSATFDDHFSQASLFWASQGAYEKDHIVAAFQYELSRVQVPAVRQRVVDNLAHVDPRLARRVAEPLGIEPPDARAAAGRAGFRDRRSKLPLESSAALGMDAGATSSVSSRRVAVIVSTGAEIGALRALQQALQQAGATCCVISDWLGSIATSAGQQLQVQKVLASTSSVFYDALVIPGGAAHVEALMQNGDAVHFLMEAYKHCKPIALVGEAARLLEVLGVRTDEAAPAGVVLGRNDPPSRAQLVQEFLAALAAHRHWGRAGIHAVPA